MNEKLERSSIGACAFVSCVAIAVCTVAFSRALSGSSQPAHHLQVHGTGSPKQSGPVMHVLSRLVVVDVTVTNSQGEPVQGLEKGDFEVFENGKRQRIVRFEHHAFEPHAARGIRIALPKGAYSNVTAHAASVPAINIILFDELNTPLAAQMRGRAQMVQLLQTLPLDQPTALFELSDQLKMIAGFSTSSRQLLAAVRKLFPSQSPLFISESEAEVEAAQSTAIGKLADSGLPLGARLLQLVDVGKLVNIKRDWGLGRRVLMTSKAFAVLSRAVAGYPGRKNILWLSGGFPLSFSPKSILSQQGVLPNSTEEMLSSAQVAVYPIDVHGLKVNGPTASTPDQLLAGPGGQKFLISAKEFRLAASQQMMSQVAQDTGGEAFYNTNDLKSALRKAIEDGSTYYTLAYVPPDRHWNGQYRHIKVSVDRRGVNLAYRRGYYAAPWNPGRQQSMEMFTDAMRPGIPESTMLAFQVKIRPPGSKRSELQVIYRVSASDISFQNSSSGRKFGQLQFVAVAYGQDGKAEGVSSQTATLNLKPATYDQLLKSGVAFDQRLLLKPGNYDLRIGVLDKDAGRFGTLDVPLRLGESPHHPQRH